MTLVLAIEAIKPDGTTFRLLFGWSFLHSLASWIAALKRLN